MSLLEKYKELDKIRLDEAEKSLAHYKSVDVPGVRTHSADTEAVRKRVEEMKKLRDAS